jgi:Xaa-Pro aminopeptidase
MPYESIVGSGTNGAILHALPTSRVVRQGELVLIDAGADRADYCVDITRVFPADGAMSSRQKSIFELVRSAQEQGIALCRPGVEWRDVHLTAARVMGQGLCDLGLLKCGIDEAIETGAVAVFFPHGVGHLVGLKVRDAGGTPNPEPKKYAGARVRVDMPLEENFIMTVEPGLYFIEALIRDGETRQSFRDQVNFAEAEKWLDFGGIRLEDDILVTSGGPQNLTGHIPK